MKKLLFLVLLASRLLYAQTNYTTYVGTIRDLTGSAVTSGRITWTLSVTSGASIPGTGAFVSNAVSCLINASGNPVANDGVSPCNIVNNTSLSPSGTYYTQCIQAKFVTPGSCTTTYATGGTVDMSVLVPAPPTQPYYGTAPSVTLLANNQPIQGGNSSGALGSLLNVTIGNVVQLGDISNKYTSLAYYLGGNSYQTVDGTNGVQFTLPVSLAQFSVNGSVNLTGAHGNGANVQTYSTSAATGPACFAADGSLTSTSCTNGSTVTLTTSGTSGAATLVGGVLNIPQYTAGGTGVGYTTPSVNFMPIVTSAAGNGTMGNSTFQDNVGTGQASIADAFTMNNSATLAAQGAASSGQNYPCNTLTLGLSYYSAGTISDAYTLGCFVNPGTTPTTLVTLYGPSTIPLSTINNGTGLLLAQNASLQASVTNGNINSPKFKLRGATRNSSGTNQLDDWNVQAIQGTGNQPTSTLTFSHTGSTGSATVSVPSLQATGGTPGIQLTAAAFSTYPACSGTTEGLEEAVTDSTTNTWGATVTGGGSFHIKMYCDSSAWTVEAK